MVEADGMSKVWNNQLLNAPEKAAMYSHLNWLTPPTGNLQDNTEGEMGKNTGQLGVLWSEINGLVIYVELKVRLKHVTNVSLLLPG